MTFYVSHIVPGSGHRMHRKRREELGSILGAWSEVQVRVVRENVWGREEGRVQAPRTGTMSISLYTPPTPLLLHHCSFIFLS